MTNFKLIVTLKDGSHKILRVTKDIVAKLCYRFRQMQKNLFFDIYIVVVNDFALVLNNCRQLRFIYEDTHREYLTLE